jgi:PAS domain S-box-containing protein
MSERHDSQRKTGERLSAEALGTRRVRLLSKLGTCVARAADVEERCRAALLLLAGDGENFLFVELHVLDRNLGGYRRVLQPEAEGEQVRWPISQVARTRQAQLVDHLIHLPQRAVESAWVLPVRALGELEPSAVLVAGCDFWLKGDEDYRIFVELVARELAVLLADARLAEERAQDELRRTLFMCSPVAICVVSGPEHRFMLANRSYIEMVSKPDLLGKTVTEVFPELVGTPLLEVFDSVYATGEPYLAPEFVTALDRDGDGVAEECFFTFNLVATRDRTGAVSGWTCTAADISAQVRARREAEAASAAAEQAREQAERACRAKDEFLAILGHELRNPLAPIVTSLYLMEKRGDQRTLPERTTIQRQVDHLVRLVDDLLDVSRVTGGKVRLQKRVVELDEIVRKAVEMSFPLFVERQHRLRLRVPAGLQLFADLQRLAQVVSNLLTNAAKYTPHGGDVSVEALLEREHVTLTVRDTGIGIRPEMLPNLFGMFVQERQALDRSLGGLGIGLAIVRGLVEMHDGTVSVYSQGLGLGSAFSVRLPIARPSELSAHLPQAQPVAPAQLPERPARAERVLVVDDNRDAANTLASVLRGMNHEVLVAHDGPSALTAMASFAPTLALLDIGLPGMDGYALAGHVRKALHPRRVRLVAVTGYGQSSDRDRAFAAGFDAHVVKPLRPEMIDAILEDLAAEPEQQVR